MVHKRKSIYIYMVRFTWDQVVSVRPTFFTWNFTPKHCEGKKKSNIRSKNTVKVTFTDFFMWRFDFLLPSQHFRYEGLDYLFVTYTAFSVWMFRFFLPLFGFLLPRKSFLGMDIRILFTFTVFCSEVSCVKPWSHAVSLKQLGLTWS